MRGSNADAQALAAVVLLGGIAFVPLAFILGGISAAIVSVAVYSYRLIITFPRWPCLLHSAFSSTPLLGKFARLFFVGLVWLFTPAAAVLAFLGVLLEGGLTGFFAGGTASSIMLLQLTNPGFADNQNAPADVLRALIIGDDANGRTQYGERGPHLVSLGETIVFNTVSDLTKPQKEDFIPFEIDLYIGFLSILVALPAGWVSAIAFLYTALSHAPRFVCTAYEQHSTQCIQCHGECLVRGQYDQGTRWLCNLFATAYRAILAGLLVFLTIVWCIAAPFIGFACGVAVGFSCTYTHREPPPSAVAETLPTSSSSSPSIARCKAGYRGVARMLEAHHASGGLEYGGAISELATSWKEYRTLKHGAILKEATYGMWPATRYYFALGVNTLVWYEDEDAFRNAGDADGDDTGGGGGVGGLFAAGRQAQEAEERRRRARPAGEMDLSDATLSRKGETRLIISPSSGRTRYAAIVLRFADGEAREEWEVAIRSAVSARASHRRASAAEGAAEMV